MSLLQQITENFNALEQKLAEKPQTLEKYHALENMVKVKFIEKSQGSLRRIYVTITRTRVLNYEQ